MSLELYISKGFKSIKYKVLDKKLKIISYIDIIFIGIQEVEKFTELYGSDKSIILLEILRLFINNNTFQLNISFQLNTLIKSQMYPQIVDTIVSIYYGHKFF